MRAEIDLLRARVEDIEQQPAMPYTKPRVLKVALTNESDESHLSSSTLPVGNCDFSILVEPATEHVNGCSDVGTSTNASAAPTTSSLCSTVAVGSATLGCSDVACDRDSRCPGWRDDAGDEVGIPTNQPCADFTPNLYSDLGFPKLDARL